MKNLKKSYHVYLLILIGITSFITYYNFKMQPDFGITWDTCDFLANALEFAGKGIGYADLDRPPFLSFLTAIIFSLGYISEKVIFALDGLIFIFGAIGLYLTFNLRFDPFKSFLGSLIYVTSPIILVYSTVGYTDIASVSFIIWGVYFTILAFQKNSKYFYLSFPFLMISFLTRYPSAIIIFPIILYFIMNRKQLKEKKIIVNLIMGIIISIIVISPVLIWFYFNFSNPFYPFIYSFSITSGDKSSYLVYYNDDTLYFLKNLNYLIGKESIIISLIAIFGLICYKIQSKFREKLKLKESLKKIFKNYKHNQKMLLLLILIPLFIVTFGNTFYMLSEVIFLVICILIYELLKNFKFRYLNMDLLFILWFMSFFIFHSVFVIKNMRYIATMAAPFSYLLILGLKEISNRFEFKFKNKKTTIFHIISIFLIIGMLLSTTGILVHSKEKSLKYSTLDDLTQASNWFKEYDPNYKDKIIYSNYWPNSAWYLKTDIKKMPVFKDNKEIYFPVDVSNLDNDDLKQYEIKLLSNNADYYFSVDMELNLTYYKEIKRFGNVAIYKKVN